MKLLFAAATEKAVVRFHAHPDVILVVLAIAMFFWWAFTRLGPRVVPAGETVVTYRNVRWIVVGVVLVGVFSYWPIHDVAEDYLFLVHMVQHTVFTMIAPACLLMGSPKWLWKWALEDRWYLPVIKVLSKPLLALLMFNSIFAFTHFQGIVNLSLDNELFHFGVHVVLFVTATIMWLPAINQSPYLPSLRMPTRMVYLFAQSIVPTVPAAFLVFSEDGLYDKYRVAPRLIPGLNALEDQQIASAIMKLGAGSFLWLIIGILFVLWWRESQAGTADDNLRTAKKAGRTSIAGMTMDGRYVDEVAAARTAAVNSGDVLTWAQVEEEFARLDRETGAIPND
jgi:putative membrane protein